MKTRLLTTVLALLAACSAAQAQPLVDRIPGDALVYVGWTGSEALPAGYAESHLKAILDASNLPQVAQMLPRVGELISKQDPHAGEAVQLAMTIGAAAWQHPTAFFLEGVEFGGDQPKPRFGLLCQAGKDAEAVTKTIQDLIDKNKDPDVKFDLKQIGGLVVLSMGDVVLPSPADGKAIASLKANKRFAAAVTQAHADPAFIAYADVDGLMQLADQAIEKGDDQQVREMWPRVRETLKLKGIHQFIATNGFEGKDWGARVFVDAPGPRAGILALLENGPVSDKALAVIPKTAATAGAVRIDGVKILPLLQEFVAKIEPSAGKSFEDGIAHLNTLLGLDLQKDVLPMFGEEWVYYTDRNVGGIGLWGTVLVNRVRDAAGAEKALAKMEKAINFLIEQNAPDKVKIAMKTTKVGDTTIHYLSVPAVSPAWALKGDKLFFGLYPQTVSAALDHDATPNRGSILDNPDFVKLRERLGGKSAMALSYMDQPQIIADGYQFALLYSQLYLGFGEIFGLDIPPLIVPPINKILPHLSASGASFWADDAGWHLRSVEPYPASEFIAGPGAALIQGAPTLLAYMIPSFASARGQAQRVTSASNENVILRGAMLWSFQNGNQLPPDLGSVMDEDIESPKVFVSPGAGVKIPADFDQWKADKKKEWVNTNSSYVYLGKGKTVMDGGNAVAHLILYEKPQFASKGKIAVGYDDGHVEVKPVREALAEVAKQEGGK